MVLYKDEVNGQCSDYQKQKKIIDNNSYSRYQGKFIEHNGQGVVHV